nr:hypothetical protein [uncultured Rhodopila sp.]
MSGDRKAILRFEEFPKAAHDRLFEALTDIEQQLEAAVIASEPTKSGALRSLTGGRVYDHANRIAAVVGVRVQTGNEARKAAALEYGSRGVAITVEAHFMTLDHIWRRAISPIAVDLPEYMRRPMITPHAFLKGPIDAVRGIAIAQMQAAIDQATQENQ